MKQIFDHLISLFKYFSVPEILQLFSRVSRNVRETVLMYIKHLPAIHAQEIPYHALPQALHLYNVSMVNKIFVTNDSGSWFFAPFQNAKLVQVKNDYEWHLCSNKAYANNVLQNIGMCQ